jgi:translation initiation factor IF-3
MLRLARAVRPCATAGRLLASLGATSAVPNVVVVGACLSLPPALDLPLPTTMIHQKRFFASRSEELVDLDEDDNNDDEAYRKDDDKYNGILVNEKLVTHLLATSKGLSADKIDVRLVVVQDNKTTSTSVVSLMKAIKISTDLAVDLVGISLNQSPPIVKAQDFARLVYQKKKSSNAGAPKLVKEFRFRGGIAEHDFNRKIDSVIKYLQKGYNCQVFIRANGLSRREDPNCLEGMIKRLSEAVRNYAIVSKVSPNPERSQVSCILQTLGKKV